MTILTGGRVNQKLRTRNALVEVASAMLRDGRSFNVADVADEARVGKTTAYRYFPTADSLIAQASVHAAAQMSEEMMDAKMEGKSAPADRLRTVFETADTHLDENQHLYRTMLRLSLSNGEEGEEHPPRRSGIRQHVLENAIGATRGELGDKKFGLLLDSLTVLIGIEADIVLKDVCLLSRDKVRAVKLWAADALLRAAETQAREAPAKPTRRAVAKSTPAAPMAAPVEKPAKAPRGKAAAVTPVKQAAAKAASAAKPARTKAPVAAAAPAVRAKKASAKT